MKFISALIFVCSVFYSVAQVKMSNSDKAEIQTILTLLKSNKSTTWKSKYAINTIDKKEYLSFVGKINTYFNPSTAKENGILIGKPIDKIVSVRIPLNQLENWKNLAGFDYLTLSNNFQVMNDRGVKDMRADSVQQGIGLPEGYTGKDVYIGITDWGFDYTSPMFTILL